MKIKKNLGEKILWTSLYIGWGLVLLWLIATALCLTYGWK